MTNYQMELWGGPLDGTQVTIAGLPPLRLLVPRPIVDLGQGLAIEIKPLHYVLAKRWRPDRGNYWVYAYERISRDG